MAEQQTDNAIQDLFAGLKALSDASFPKHCANCGATYDTVEDYVGRTDDVSGVSGLKKGIDDDDRTIVELFRNCPCGSTLMDCFSDRRDISAAGLKRRRLFGQLKDLLTAKGLDDAVARAELLKLIRGEKSDVLEKMGVSARVR